MTRNRRSTATSLAVRHVFCFPAPAALAVPAALVLAVFAAGCPGVQPRIPGHGPLDPHRAAPDKDAPEKDGEAMQASGAAAPDLARVDAVDLTQPFDARTIYWPTAASGFDLKEVHKGDTPGGFYYEANTFSAPEHGGTHLDAPAHFARGGASVDRVPIVRLIAPAAVIDVSAKAAADRDYRLTPDDVRGFEARNGPIPPGTIVLLRTGWSSRWPDRKAYLGDDAPGDAANLHFPSFGPEAAELLVRERKAAAIGVDTASIDHGPAKDFPVHRIAAAAGVPGFENLARLEALPETGAWLIALPMKIAGGSGAPLRAVALITR